MKRKRKILLLILAAVFIAGSIAAAYAAVETQSGVKNTVRTGGVSIDVNTFTMKDGSKVPLEEKTVIDRNKDISYIPRIKNNAEDCYVRVKLSAESDQQKVDMVKEIAGIQPGWKLIGGYLYNTKPLEHDQTVELCSGFHMPEDWDYMKSNELSVKVTADAIQAKNFTPDFTSETENPWGDVAIRNSAVGDDYVINTVDPAETKGNIKVIYANAVKGITINSDDFFADVNFMPGDKYSDCLTVSNQTRKKATIMFKTEFKDSPLLDMMQMQIDNGSVFYNGPMASDSLKDYQKIASLKPGETKKITVELELPAQADNKYQVNSDQVKWYFAIEQDTDKGIRTGDSANFWILSGIMLIAAAGMFLLVLRKEQRNESI